MIRFPFPDQVEDRSHGNDKMGIDSHVNGNDPDKARLYRVSIRNTPVR